MKCQMTTEEKIIITNKLDLIKLGTTPWQTFLDSKHPADEKMLNRLQPADTNIREVSSGR